MYQPVSEFRISDSEIPKSFSIGLGFDAVGVVTEALINPDFNLTALIWPHLHPRIFGAGSTHLPCSGEVRCAFFLQGQVGVGDTASFKRMDIFLNEYSGFQKNEEKYTSFRRFGGYLWVR